MSNKACFWTCLLLPSLLEKKVQELEEQRQVELKILQEEKEQIQTLILRQTAIIGELEQQLLKVSTNNSVLQHQQQELLDTVNNLIHTLSAGPAQGRSPFYVKHSSISFLLAQIPVQVIDKSIWDACFWAVRKCPRKLTHTGEHARSKQKGLRWRLNLVGVALYC